MPRRRRDPRCRDRSRPTAKRRLETPAQNLQQDVDAARRAARDEADAILDESKKDFKVTKRGLGDCMKDWDPQTQMSKAEWEESCRTTLEYFPDGR